MDAPRPGGDAPTVAATVRSERARVETLKKRADFLAAARARRWAAEAFVLQARRREAGERAAAEATRIGFTCSKKVGNAVARNRARRRLREAARATLPALGRPGWDYVLVGRPESTVARPFALLLDDLAAALARVHADPPARPPRPRPADAARGAP